MDLSRQGWLHQVVYTDYSTKYLSEFSESMAIIAFLGLRWRHWRGTTLCFDLSRKYETFTSAYSQIDSTYSCSINSTNSTNHSSIVLGLHCTLSDCNNIINRLWRPP